MHHIIPLLPSFVKDIMTQSHLIVLKGLPGSGKTTFAKQYQADHPGTLRTNKDELRAVLHDGVYSKSNERFVLKVRDYVIDQALSEGHDVVCDDTNLAPKHLARMEEIAAKHGAIVEIKDFTDMPLEECIRRDLARPRSVGERVIRGMHRQFLEAKSAPPVYDPTLPDCIICDLDGTLALFDRDKVSPYDRDFSKDEVNEAINDLLGQQCSGTDIFIFSGRKDTFKEQTLHWLKENNVYYNHLSMRRADDTRKDVVIKEEMYNEHIRGKYNVVAVFDDRLQTCRLWHRLSLPLFRVGDPDADF
jgi:predicted kinase